MVLLFVELFQFNNVQLVLETILIRLSQVIRFNSIMYN